jgi:hypothetical protein
MPIIYKLIGGDECYIGATIRTLNTRFREHKYHNGQQRPTSSKILFDKYGRDGVKIELLEEIDNDNLKIRETYWIENSPNCVNKIKSIPVTPERRREIEKKSRDKHRDIIHDRANIKIECECGGKYTHCNKLRHLKSPKHLNHHHNQVAISSSPSS